MHRIAGVLALLVMLGWGQVTYAQFVSYHFTGTTINSCGTIQPGAHVTGSFSYEINGNPDQFPGNPDIAGYLAAFSVSIEGETATSGSATLAIQDTASPFINNSLTVSALLPTGTLGGLSLTGMALGLVDFTGTVFTSTALPGPTLQLSDFSQGGQLGAFFFNSCRLSGPITSLATSQGMVANLIDDVISLNLQTGISNSFDAKLDAVFDALDDINENNDVSVVNALYAFINAVEAQRGKQISEADADDLIAAAQAIITALGG